MVSDSSQGSDQSCFPRIKSDSFESSHSQSPAEKGTQPSWHLFLFFHLWKRRNGPTMFASQQGEKSSFTWFTTTAESRPPLCFYTVLEASCNTVKHYFITQAAHTPRRSEIHTVFLSLEPTPIITVSVCNTLGINSSLTLSVQEGHTARNNVPKATQETSGRVLNVVP